MSVKVISDKFGGIGTACQNSWDAMHTFSTRKVGGFFGKDKSGASLDKGGRMHAKVSEALKAFYKDGLNPCITAIKLNVIASTWTVEYEVTIEESPDGNAYVGLNSWGGASGGYPTKKPPSGHAYSNYITKRKEIGGTPGVVIADVLDFYFPGGFRQIFFQHTDPSYPNKPKSANAKTGTVGVQIGPSGSPTNLPEHNNKLLYTTSIKPGTDTTPSTIVTQSSTQSAGLTAKVGTVDGTSTSTGGSFDFVTLKECFISVPPRRGGSVPIFIYYPKNEVFDTEFEKSENIFEFSIGRVGGSYNVKGTHSGIKMANRVIGFDNKFFKLNGNKVDEQILAQKESPVKDWFKKYVNVFVNNPYSDFNKVVQEVVEQIESRALLPSSLNLFLYGESTSADTPVMMEIPNLTANIKTLTLIEAVPTPKLVDISRKIKAAGGQIYYTYNPNLFNIDLTDITLVKGKLPIFDIEGNQLNPGETATYSFKNGTIGRSSAMFPDRSMKGFTPSVVSNPVVSNSGLTTSFWDLKLPISVNKNGATWQLGFGGEIESKAVLATGPTGSDYYLIPFLPGGLYEGFSPRGLVWLNGKVIHRGPKFGSLTNINFTNDLSIYRNFFSTISYDNKDWIFTTTATASGTGSTSSAIVELGVTFSFRHRGLKDTLVPFTYTKLSDDLIKLGAYVYDLSKDAEYNRARAGGTSSGWPELIQQPATPQSATASSQSGTTASISPISNTMSFSVRYLNLQTTEPELDIEITPQLALQIFSYDIESIVGKSANPSQTSTQIPKIRGKFVFDVRFKDKLINDQLGEFTIIDKTDIDPFIPSSDDDLSGLDPSFLEESFSGEEESLDDDLPSDDLKTFLGELYNEEDAQAEKNATQQVAASTSGSSTLSSSGPEQDINLPGKIKVIRSDSEIFWTQLAGYNGKTEIPSGSNAGDPVARFLKDVGLGVGNPWCMAFVYSQFKEFCDKKGLKNPLPKVGGCKNFWSLCPKDFKILASSAAANPKLIKGGQIFIKSRDGGGHTGIVLKADGPSHFLSIDGNSSDKVRLNRYQTSSMIGFIDFFSNPYFQDSVEELATPLLKSSKIQKGGGKET